MKELASRVELLEGVLAKGLHFIEWFDLYSMKGVDVDGDGFTEEYHVVPKTGNWHRVLGWASAADAVLKGKQS